MGHSFTTGSVVYRGVKVMCRPYGNGRFVECTVGALKWEGFEAVKAAIDSILDNLQETSGEIDATQTALAVVGGPTTYPSPPRRR